MARTVVPFGPQHPVFPEPIQLKLVVEDEIVKEAIPTLGYVHRGLEKLAEIRDFHQMVQVVERTCGICSMIHAMCYCQGIEELMGIEVPDRARYLRTVWSELHRMHSHLLWMGLHADAFGFESLFMQLWKIREKVLDINEATAGNRIIVSVNVVGGVRADLSTDQQRWILKEVAEVDRMVRDLERPLLEDVTVKHRTVGVGVLTRQQAHELGAVGPVARASGLPLDMRMLKYAGFRELDFEPWSKRLAMPGRVARFAIESSGSPLIWFGWQWRSCRPATWPPPSRGRQREKSWLESSNHAASAFTT